MIKAVFYSEPLEEFRPGADGSGETSSISGDAVNAAVAARKAYMSLNEYRQSMGASNNSPQPEISILCGIGDDERGRKIANFLEKNNISGPATVTVPGHKSAAYRIPPSSSGRPTEYIDRGASREELAASAMCKLLEEGGHAEAVEEALKTVTDPETGADIFVITGIGASRARSDAAFAKLVAAAEAVKERCGKVIVDLNHRFDPKTWEARLWVDDNGKPLPNDRIRARMDRLFSLADVAFIAHDEAAPLYGNLYHPPFTPDRGANAAELIEGNPKPLIKYFNEVLGARHIVFKRGKEGVILYPPSGSPAFSEIVIRGYKVEDIVDRTGGGDALIGGVVAGLMHGLSLDESVRAGVLMASRVIQHQGGVIQDHVLPSVTDLAAIMGNARTSDNFLKQRLAMEKTGSYRSVIT